MDKVELVIKIDKDVYEARQHWVANPKKMIGKVDMAIANGIPLPKGHGKIGDLTKLYNEIDARNKGKNKGKYTGILALVGFADTIIEADKAESEVLEDGKA